MQAIVLLVLIGFTTVAALPRKEQRIVEGSDTTIENYPYGAALLYAWDLHTYSQNCGGAIISNEAILTAAHCVYGDVAKNWRIRVGSSWANSGGTVHNTDELIIHPSYEHTTLDNDIAILRTSSAISLNSAVRSASIAGPDYDLDDNESVWAIGWGTTSVSGITDIKSSSSEQLQHVELLTVNQSACESRYSELGLTITDNMLCAGWLDVGGRDQCQGDSGGPLIHNGVVVGVSSFGEQCAFARYPGVNARVSLYLSWIESNKE